jgi:hypothetical protein
VARECVGDCGACESVICWSGGCVDPRFSFEVVSSALYYFRVTATGEIHLSWSISFSDPRQLKQMGIW